MRFRDRLVRPRKRLKKKRREPFSPLAELRNRVIEKLARQGQRLVRLVAVEYRTVAEGVKDLKKGPRLNAEKAVAASPFARRLLDVLSVK